MNKVLSPEDEAKFKKLVLELFKAGWRTTKIAEWAATAASGYGHYFTKDEALPKINVWCKEYNNEVSQQNRELADLARKSLIRTASEFNTWKWKKRYGESFKQFCESKYKLLDFIEPEPLPPGKGAKIIYKRAHPYGAPLLIIRGGGTKIALPWFRTVKTLSLKEQPIRVFSWDDTLHGWTGYMLRDEVEALMNKFKEAGYTVLKKDEL